MFRRSIVSTFLVFACGAASIAQARASDQCSLELLENNAARVAEACMSILKRDDITTASRVDALKIHGRAMQRLDRYADAISDYEAGLNIAPDDAELHLRRGWTAFEELRRGWRASGGISLGQAEVDAFYLAMDQARQALKLRPRYADAYSLVGAALSLATPDKYAEAKAAYDEAIKINPTDPDLLLKRFLLLRQSGHFEEAIEDAEAVLRLPADLITKPSSFEYDLRRTTFRIGTEIERAKLLRSLGRTNEALQAYDEAVKRDPDPITYTRRAAFKLSQIAFFPGMPPQPLDAVQDDLNKALALDPDFWSAHEQQGYLHFVREQYDMAATEYARGLKQYPKNGHMRWMYALALRKLERGEEAASEAITAFRMDPGSWPTSSACCRSKAIWLSSRLARIRGRR